MSLCSVEADCLPQEPFTLVCLRHEHVSARRTADLPEYVHNHGQGWYWRRYVTTSCLTTLHPSIQHIPLLLVLFAYQHSDESSLVVSYVFFFFNDTATTEIYTLSLHDALPIYGSMAQTSPRLPEKIQRDTQPRPVTPLLTQNKLGGLWEIGRAHVWTPVTSAHLVCRLLLEKKNKPLPIVLPRTHVPFCRSVFPCHHH